MDKNDPDLIPLNKLIFGEGFPFSSSPEKKCSVGSRQAKIHSIISKLPVQRLRQNESTDLDADVISCIRALHKNAIILHKNPVIHKKHNHFMNYLSVFLAANLVAITDLTIGLDCLARYTDDGIWYRAIDCDVKNEKVVVQFVDYGNFQLCDSLDLFVLHEEFTRIAPFAFRCSLAGIRKSRPWTDDENARFCVIREEDTFKVSFLRTDGEHHDMVWWYGETVFSG